MAVHGASVMLRNGPAKDNNADPGGAARDLGGRGD